ncbi:bifunctional methylenetetrahydrofolate dehydrogenase/methenyltetrahydrofolate cyclohydrolase [Methanohalobium sp.]|uniref:bifunctional methylenetetrahydrofolate dehydrogenase/methenyltetrahydrofolate cyclohydrolase n=1 Tax=Methanohalobium sp. TaxID=2837493 RepID=UPI0026013FEC|nr:bifunctional methylenetetrahydrofolate dehydrogenase/methenyltetrahydrofolate cyclohydrolase [Methanohalobium sp.]
MPEGQNYDSKIIDGRSLSKKIESELSYKVQDLKDRYNITPGLSTIVVGDDPASKMYVRLKHKACDRVGIIAEDHFLSEDTTQDELIELVHNLNSRDDIHGILVQLPLPEHINEQKVMMEIDPLKDADGFHPQNMGNLLIGNEELVPCTPKGIMTSLEEYDVGIEGSDVVVVGHSNVVGKPMATMLLNRNATVSVCHVYTSNLNRYTVNADILIVATGVKHLIKSDMVKEGVVVIDAGISKEGDKVYGDVDFDNVKQKASLITPVPGGVGPLTIATLMQHVLKSAQNKI